MKSASYRPRGFSPLKGLSFLLVALLVGAVTTVGTLAALGVVDLPFLKQVQAKPRPKGVPVLLSARAIPAYSKVSREDFFDPKTGEPLVRYVSSEEVEKHGFMTDLSKILGRVLSHEKAAGYAFTEQDFFPEKTRPGLVAGVPPGKRAFVLPADKIEGIQSLREGDHFDLIATLPVDLDKVYSRLHAGPGTGAMLEAQASLTDLPKKASVKVLVENGTVILPLTTRQVPINSSSGTREGPPPTRPVQEITIAIEPTREAAALTEALAIKAEIICLARSGQVADSSQEKDTQGSTPAPNLRTVETIIGNKRQVLVFPGPGKSPQVISTSEPSTPSAPEKTTPSSAQTRADAIGLPPE
ncbi:MAG: hypothetical protein JO112_12810 [Planctomycetes bacterium]|nr:hypothetical protein [Planctomycetota bacterium]